MTSRSVISLFATIAASAAAIVSAPIVSTPSIIVAPTPSRVSAPLPTVTLATTSRATFLRQGGRKLYRKRESIILDAVQVADQHVRLWREEIDESIVLADRDILYILSLQFTKLYSEV